MIAWSAGLTFCSDGGVGMSGGSWRAARAIIDCTSCAAASMSRSSVNWRVMLVLPERVGRADRVHAGDRRELLLERRGHGRRHGLRARAGQRRLDLDGGEVHGRQVADRQLQVAHRPEDHDRQDDERRRDRPANEDVREVHDGPRLAAAGLAARHPRAGRQPEMTVGDDDLAGLEPRGDDRLVAFGAGDGDRAHLDLGFAIDDEHVRTLPAPPARRATARRRRAGSALRNSVASTNCPGQRRLPALSKVAFSLIVPVVASTALSMNVRRPDTVACVGRPRQRSR